MGASVDGPIHGRALAFAEVDGRPGDDVFAATGAGFVKVAEAMLAEGVD
ncbi:MAG TPA: hypothetical protein VK277_06880 [Acidimicrobiales bacterium]|nr:hypothetical protein [Acidimicrobiales bacterium]